MNTEQMLGAAVKMQAAAELMERVYGWWQQDQERAYLRNAELLARFESAIERASETLKKGNQP